MGLLFFPRGGSAQVARYLSTALADAHWSVELVTGSLGDPGEFTHAPTFFAGTPLQHLDYSDAVRVFTAGGSAISARVPMHPSYEDREDAPDVVFAAVPDDLAEHLSSVWESPFRAAGADRAHVFHLHHLTPQHDAVRRHWPQGAVVAHLHGTEIKFLEAVNARAALAKAVGTTLAGMPAWVRVNPGGSAGLNDRQRELLRTTRWDWWRYGEAWRDRLLRQADAADHLVLVSPTERGRAVEVLEVDADRVSDVPNGVDVTRFCPRPMSREARRNHFRRWLVEDPRGWNETSVAGTVGYREADLDRLLGPDGDATVLLFVGRFTSAKRVPLLVRAFARARARFDRPASLVVWGGYPGEWEGEHPVTVAGKIGAEGLFFAGWRGHADLPEALAASDALVIPSVDDSYPQAPLEAMAVGLPVIATSSGGFPFVVNLDPARPTGWLVPPDDERALSEVLVGAVNRPQELSRRGGAALAHARSHLSWASRVELFEEAYASARDWRARGGSAGASSADRPNRAR
jgi:glycosyltransferase involved in cell wall biosynthesis